MPAGVHGANRLASNSLLEGLVFGALAAEAMTGQGKVAKQVGVGSFFPAEAVTGMTSEAETERWITELRALMWQNAGLLRDKVGLERAQQGLEALAVTKPQGLFRRAVEARNLHLVAWLIVEVALRRTESRGAHFRTDFPEPNDAGRRHSVMGRGWMRHEAWGDS